MNRYILSAFCMLLLCIAGYSQKVVPPKNSSASSKGEKIMAPINPQQISPLNDNVTNSKETNTQQKIWTVGNELHTFQSLKTAVESSMVGDGDIIHLYKHIVEDGYPDVGIYINKNLEIVGMTDDGLTKVSASGTEGSSDRRCFVIEAGYKVTLSNLQLSRGYAKEHWGGAIFNSGELELNNCRVVNNQADIGGGGIYNGGTLTISGGSIDDNTAQYGGGLMAGEYATTKLEGAYVSVNHADWGGAAYNLEEAYLEFKRCKINGNTAKNGAGAINDWGQLYIVDSDIFSNQCTEGSGGAIQNSNSFCTILDSRIYENTAQTSGGALSNSYTIQIKNTVFYKNKSMWNQGAAIANFGNAHLYRVTLTDNTGYGAYSNTAFFDYTQTGCISYLTNCTVTNNHDDEAGGIELYDDNGGSTITLTNTIVAGNNGGGVDLMLYNGSAHLNGNNIIGTTDSLLYFYDITDIIGVDPLLDGLTNVSGTVYHHPLKINSPAINAITNDTENAEKAAGESGDYQKVGTYDIGATESDHDTYNTTVWSIWGSPNHNFDTLNNVVVVSENDYIWSDRINNLIIGPDGILDVNDTLEVKGKLFNYGTGRSLVLHENVPFVYDDDSYRNPVFYEMNVTNDGISPMINFSFDPVGQVNTIIVEYGSNGELTNVYNTNKEIWNVGKQSETVRIPEPNFEGMSYRLRFANKYYNFVTDVRTATLASDASFINDRAFKVYPNPAKNIVHIELDAVSTTDQVNVSIKDVNGRTVLSQVGSVPKSSINLAGLKSGIYWLCCETPNGTMVRKLALTGEN